MLRILLAQRALRDLDSMDLQTRKRIVSKLKEVRSDLLHRSRKLSNAEIGTYRLRIGVYRVVFDLHGDTAVILRVGHRKDIYKIFTADYLRIDISDDSP